MEQEKFEQWCVIELFGHNRIAGLVSDAQIGGATFIRVDVPQVKDDVKGFTRFFGPAAIYGINPVSEQIAREMAKRIDSRPIVAWEIGFDPQRQIPFKQQEMDDDSLDEYDPEESL